MVSFLLPVLFSKLYFRAFFLFLLRCFVSSVAGPINIPIPQSFEIQVIDNKLGENDKTR